MRALAGAVVVVAALSGCGQKSAPPSLAEGAHVFAAQCSGCHTLQASRGRLVKQGGPLAGYRLTSEQIQSFVRQMPTPRPLTERELKAVVAYVSHAQRTGGTAK